MSGVVQGEDEARHRELAARLKLLLESTSHLIETLETKELLKVLLNLSREIIAADAFGVWRMDEGAIWSMVTSQGLSDQFIQESIQSARPVNLPDGPIVVQPEDIADRSDELLQNRWDRYDREGIRSLIILPLRIHGEISGTLVLYCRTPHRFSEWEIEAAAALANIAAAAITTAELYESQWRLRREAEKAAVRESFLAAAGAIFSESLDYEQTLVNVARAAVPDFADWSAVDLMDDEGVLRRLAVAHVDPDKVRLAQELHEKYPPDDRLGVGVLHVIRTGRPEMMEVIPESLLERGARDQDHLRILRELKLTSYICVPLTVGGKVQGALTFVSSDASRRFQPSDLSIAQEIGRRAAQAIHNSRLYRDLREREERYELVVAGAESAIWDWDIKAKTVNYSPRWKQLRGIEDGEISDSEEEWLRGIHPDDRDRVTDAIQAHFEGKSPVFAEEYRVRHKDGRWIWILDRGIARRNEAGTVIRMAGSETDITERKEAEEKVREHAHALEIINGVNLSLAAEVELEKIVQIATDAGTDVTTAEFGAFFYNVVDADSGKYMLYALSGAPREAFEKFQMPRATELFGPTFRGEGVIRIDDVLKDPRYGKAPPYNGMPPGHLPVRSYLAVPVISRTGEIHGGLFYGHSRPGVFTARHEQIVSGIAAQAAIALDNSRLYADLRNSEGRYKQVVQGVPAAVYTVDGEGRITLCNESAVELWGREPVIGEDKWCGSWRIYRPDGVLLPHEECPMARTLRERRSVREEIVIERPDGTRRNVLSYPQPFFDSDGNVTGAVKMLVDITDRKRAEEALRESEERFRLMANAAPVLIWLAGTDKLCTWFNKSWLDFVGRTMEQELGNGWLENVHPEDFHHCLEAYSTAFDAREPFTMEYRMRRHDGEYRWILNNGIPRYGSNQLFTGYIGSCIDITDHKLAEESLKRSHDELELRVAERTAELARQNRSLRRLAHELTETEQRERRKLSDALHDGLQQILVAAKFQVSLCEGAGAPKPLARLEKLLDEAIKTSRSLSYELSPPALHASELPHALKWLARWFSTNHDFEMVLRVDENFPALPENIKIFLFNSVRELVFNCVKHSGCKSAQVELEVAQHPIARVIVADNGRGFDAASTEAESNGELHGFGLFAIRERISAFGGELTIEARPGTGAKFVLDVPVGEEAATEQATSLGGADASAAALDSRRNGNRPTRLLIADDHDVFREGLVVLLQDNEEIELVGEASDGIEALHKVEELKPDVVLMDLHMPRMNGIEATRQIKRTFPGVEVIALSFHEEQEMAEKMFEAGARAYFQKGGDSEFLMKAIQDATESRRLA